MDDEHLDEIDRRILSLLQEDARNNTNAAISEAVGVSPSTVGNRIARLEAQDIVQGYHPNIDYKPQSPRRVLSAFSEGSSTHSDYCG